MENMLNPINLSNLASEQKSEKLRSIGSDIPLRAIGLRVLAVVLGLVLVNLGLRKLIWFSNPRPTAENLTAAIRSAPEIARWYLRHFLEPGMLVYARLIGVIELVGGIAFVVGFFPRLVATLVFLIEISFFAASGSFSHFRWLFSSSLGAMPLLGSLIALMIGGNKLPWSLWPRAATEQETTAGAIGMRILSTGLGLFLLVEGWPKLSWVVDSTVLTQQLNGWIAQATPGSLTHWYLENVALPGASIFAPLVALGETAAGFALILGCLPRVTACLASFMVLNILAGQAEQIFSHIVGWFVLGGLIALGIGGGSLPWGVPWCRKLSTHPASDS